jgi:entericidin B
MRNVRPSLLRIEMPRAGLLGVVVVMAAGLMLSGCNTTAGVGKDVSATGAAVTRGANDVKTGL